MNQFFNCLISTNGLAYLTGAVIFFITLLLAAKRFIGLGVTFIFLIFALIAAQAVSNQEAIKEYVNKWLGSAPTTTYKAGNTSENQKVDINTELQKAYDDLKKEFMLEKEKLQKLYEQVSKQNSTESNQNPEENTSKNNKTLNK